MLRSSNLDIAKFTIRAGDVFHGAAIWTQSSYDAVSVGVEITVFT